MILSVSILKWAGKLGSACLGSCIGSREEARNT